MLKDMFAGIGIATLVTVFCFTFIIVILKINDFLKDIHTISENTKKAT